MPRFLVGLGRSATMMAVAGVLVLGGGAYALASSSSSKTISACVTKKTGVLYVGKCTKHAKKLKWNVTGPKGATGSPGAKGATGAQGPGATVLAYNAVASASPTMHTIGTLLGVTLSAECSIPTTGEEATTVYVQTNGAYEIDYSESESAVGASTGNIEDGSSNEPALALASPAALLPITAGNSSIINGQIELTELAPVAGYMVVHATANADPGPTCHVSVMSFPTTTGAISSSARPSGAGRPVPKSPKRLLPLP